MAVRHASSVKVFTTRTRPARRVHHPVEPERASEDGKATPSRGEPGPERSHPDRT